MCVSVRVCVSVCVCVCVCVCALCFFNRFISSSHISIFFLIHRRSLLSSPIQLDAKVAFEEAARLYRAGEGKLGTDEKEFISILTSHSRAMTAAITEHYTKVRRAKWRDC